MEYFIGIAASLFAQFVKKFTGTGTFGSYLVIFFSALFFAALYVVASDGPFWEVVVRILTVAGAFHNFILRRFEETTDEMEEVRA